MGTESMRARPVTAQAVMVVSLGCPKNLVDSEAMCRILTEAGFVLTTDPEQADVIAVNTCGFIESAKKEAIDTLLEMSDYKAPAGRCRFLVACGCLAQRYAAEIRTQLPEVDAVVGTAHYHEIASVIQGLLDGAPGMVRCSQPGSLLHLRPDRMVTTRGYAYLKIAEGCSNLCTYCAIPGMRGPFVSRLPADVMAEAEMLVAQGYRELILVAQDTTRYGSDLPTETPLASLVSLLQELERIPGLKRIRLMYCYLDGVTDALIDHLARSQITARYLDVPIQHLSDGVLKRMGRKETAAEIRGTIAKLRERVPGIVLRSTVMVGFPGETAADFDELLRGLRALRFDRLGCFVFSSEEGTPADRLRPRVRKDVAQRRCARVMELQQQITFHSNQARVGSEVEVLLDSRSEDGLFYCGRSEGEAPDIDPVILIPIPTHGPELGSWIRTRIVAAMEYEMTGETL